MYSWRISWISWCLDGAGEVCGCNLCFSLRTVLPDSKQQGAVLNEVSLSVVTFCPLRLMGLLQSCLQEEGERKRIKREREKEKKSVCGVCVCVFVCMGGYCIAQHNSVRGGQGRGWKGSRWIYICSLLPLFYISIVFGQAPLYMCNYHWHCYFFQTQVQASTGWLVCFVSPGHS